MAKLYLINHEEFVTYAKGQKKHVADLNQRIDELYDRLKHLEQIVADKLLNV